MQSIPPSRDGDGLRTAGGEPSHPPPSHPPPPPPCLCEVTAARDLPLICPLSPCTQSGEAWKARGRRQMENREKKTKGLLQGGQKAGLCPPSAAAWPAQPLPSAPGLDHPRGCWQPAPPLQRPALDLTWGRHSLGGPREATFLVSVK